MIKVTIIIPVYNVEKYIEQCLDSVINQTLKDIEIIIINDGSTDSSKDICDKYKIKDDRIKVIDKENGGLSSARNCGLKIANGETILFLDSDDFFMNNTVVEDMYMEMKKNNVNILSGNAMLFYDDKNEYKEMKKNLEFKIDELLTIEKFILKSGSCDIAPVCFYLYKRVFLQRNSLLFKEGVYHEDELFTYQCLLKADKIYIFTKPFYAYRQREGSIMSTKNTKKGLDAIQHCLDLEKEYSEVNSYKLRAFLYKRAFNIILENIYKYKLNTRDKNINSYLKKYSCTLKDKLRATLYIINPSLYIKLIGLLLK